jgi:hypothetical protein
MMSNHRVDNSRRRFVKLTAFGVAAAPLGNLLLQGSARAEMPKLEESDPMAVNLGYVHDASKADPANRAGEAGAKQFCNNCTLYKADADAEWGECAIFPGKLVNGNGWCKSWVAKT